MRTEGNGRRDAQLADVYIRCTLALYNAVSDAIYLLRQDRPARAAALLEREQKEMQAVLAQTFGEVKIDLTRELPIDGR